MGFAWRTIKKLAVIVVLLFIFMLYTKGVYFNSEYLATHSYANAFVTSMKAGINIAFVNYLPSAWTMLSAPFQGNFGAFFIDGVLGFWPAFCVTLMAVSIFVDMFDMTHDASVSWPILMLTTLGVSTLFGAIAFFGFSAPTIISSPPPTFDNLTNVTNVTNTTGGNISITI